MWRRHRKGIWSALGLVVTGIAFLMCLSIYNAKDLNQLISELGSADFSVARRAQKEILACGSTAVPALRSAFSPSESQQKRGLIAFLIGELDPAAYKRLLLEAADQDGMAACALYISTAGLQSMSADERGEVIAHWQQLQTTTGLEGARAASRILGSLAAIDGEHR